MSGQEFDIWGLISLVKNDPVRGVIGIEKTVSFKAFSFSNFSLIIKFYFL